MGFSGGGSNVTKPHTHDSNIVQDGGSLAANVTQFGLTAGSILYSDGSNIQELGVGSSGDSLVVNGAATAPEWGGGAAGAWTSLGNVTSGSTAELSLDVADYDIYEVIYNVSADASASSGKYMSATINGVTTNTYRSTWSYSSGGAWTTAYNLAQPMFRLNGADLHNYATNNMFGTFTLFKPQTESMINRVSLRAVNGNLSPTGTNYISTMFGDSTETSVSSIQLKVDGTNIQGSFRVNGLNFS
jgi:hypothetical protein